MRNIYYLLFLSLLLLTSCGNSGPDHEHLHSLIQKKLSLPRIIEHDVLYSDSTHAQNSIMNKLEQEGWVILQKQNDSDKPNDPLILFTEKSEPYLSPKSEMDKLIGIQKVRIAEEDIDSIIATNHDLASNSIEVEYTTIYRNVTIFASLIAIKEKQVNKRKIQFIFSQGVLEPIK